MSLLTGVGKRRPAEAEFDIAVSEPDLTPGEAALRELDRIEALDLANRGFYQQHYTLVSETIRRYLERRFGVLAMESPTSWTMEALAGITAADRLREPLGEIMSECDLVKFARYVPEEDRIRGLIERARRVVRPMQPGPEGTGEEGP
jgi:hypothetical protein